MNARLTPLALGASFAIVPLFPAFITFTSVSFPGVSLLPRWAVFAVLALCAVIAAYFIVELNRTPGRRSPIATPMFAWFAAALCSALAGFNPRDGLVFVGIFGATVLWHVVVVRWYDRPNVARAIYWNVVLSGALASIAAIAMVVLRVPAAQYTIGHGRAIGTFILPGELAGYLIIFVSLTFGLARASADRRLRLAALAACAIGTFTMLLTFSRAGWVGLACAAAFYVALGVRSRFTGFIAGSALVASTLLVVFALFNVHHNPSENYTRISIWQAALGIIDRFPLTGVGAFGFSHVYPLVRQPDGDATAFHAHSVYLTFLAEMGVVGFSAFLWTWIDFARAMRRRLAVAPPHQYALALAITAGLVGTLVQGLIDTVSVVIFGLWLPMLALALASARADAARA